MCTFLGIQVSPALQRIDRFSRSGLDPPVGASPSEPQPPGSRPSPRLRCLKMMLTVLVYDNDALSCPAVATRTVASTLASKEPP